MRQVAEFHKEAVMEYTIENAFLKVTALNFGGTITGIYWKEDHTNLVASYLHPQDYIEQGGPYLNALVGPVAGRIAYGRYELDGSHQLSINNGVHHLHGGESGISKQLFQVEQLSDHKLSFHLCCEHAADGYPNGTYEYTILYELLENTLQIQYHCTPPARTLLNMTSHLYFNLSGMEHDIRHHQLYLPATKKCRIAQEGHPDEIYKIQKDSAFDFSTLRDIQENLEKGDPEFANTLQYDTPFLLDKGELTLYDPISTHRLDICTEQNSVVVYSANWFDDALLFENKSKGYPMCCLALETQDVPNGINLADCDCHQIADPQHPYTQTTCYRFGKGV